MSNTHFIERSLSLKLMTKVIQLEKPRPEEPRSPGCPSLPLCGWPLLTLRQQRAAEKGTHSAFPKRQRSIKGV